MSLNDSLNLTLSPTPWTLNNVPFSNFVSVILGLIVVVCCFVALVLWFWVFAKNRGKHVTLEIFVSGDGAVQVLSKWHEIGYSRMREGFDTAEQAGSYVKRLVERGFGEVAKD